MSFGAAFEYPFKSLAKVFTIVLGFAILIAALAALAMNARTIAGAMILVVGTGIAQALFLAGYGIRVIRHLMDGLYGLPALDIIRDIGRGVVVVIAAIVHFLPLIGIAVIGGMLGAFDVFNYYGGDEALAPFLLTIMMMIPLGIYLSWGLAVGMIRYAADEHSHALFDFGTNFGYVNDNKRSALTLTGYQFLLGVLYWIATQVFNTLYTNIASGMITYRTDQNFLLLIIIISYILSITLSLFQNFSNLHIMYQFAEQIGIDRVTEKLKHKPDPLRYDG